MLSFSPRQPVPLIGSASISHSEAELHAKAVDQWLGLNIEQVEAQLQAKGCRSKAPSSGKLHQELWFGLDSQKLQTPYVEIRHWLDRLQPKAGSQLVDLGAAYGRMGFVVGWHFPHLDFVGYEYVGERVEEARKALKKWNFPRVCLEHADLASSTFQPIVADYYFIYDFGTDLAIEKVLHDLRRIAKVHPITIIARGRRCREFIDVRHAWLKPRFPGESESKVTIYCSPSHGFQRHAGF